MGTTYSRRDFLRVTSIAGVGLVLVGQVGGQLINVPLAHAQLALSRTEELLRAQFADVVGTAISYLLSDGRDVAIQMAAVAATMAGSEVRGGVAAIISEIRAAEEDG